MSWLLSIDNKHIYDIFFVGKLSLLDRQEYAVAVPNQENYYRQFV